MMPHFAMQKRISPGGENGLDNAGNCQPNRALNHGPILRKHLTIRALRPASQEERPCVFITIATPT
jgi:hypothetical protein